MEDRRWSRRGAGSRCWRAGSEGCVRVGHDMCHVLLRVPTVLLLACCCVRQWIRSFEIAARKRKICREIALDLQLVKQWRSI